MDNEVFAPLLEQFMLTPLVAWVRVAVFFKKCVSKHVIVAVIHVFCTSEK